MSPCFNSTDDLQTQTLCACTLLEALRPALRSNAWPGALLLNIHLDAPGAALSLAAHIAGAVCLTLDSDTARTRAALRSGACDFVVNTLDEALRAIKNEIRQHRPLSVALEGQSGPLLDEILARGLAPQLFTAPTEHQTHAAALASFGARLLDLRAPAAAPAAPPQSPDTAAAILELFLAVRPWTAHTLRFAAPAELRAFEARALSMLDPEDALRRRWLTSAPRLFPRDRHRTLWLTPDEAVHLRP